MPAGSDKRCGAGAGAGAAALFERRGKMAENMKALMLEKLNQAYTAEKQALEKEP